jgi:hypothetical protein
VDAARLDLILDLVAAAHDLVADTLDLVAATEAWEQEARRAETYRELLGQVLHALGEDLPPDLRTAIERALSS